MGRVSLIACAFGLVACGDDNLSMGRADTGIAVDASSDDPLGLEAGMTISYRAVLTYRDSLNGAERNAVYTFGVRIDSVDDRRGASPSSLRFSAIDPTTTNDDWSATDDFDSWVGRLGPSRPGDQVSSTPLEESLVTPPRIPPAPTPTKQIPAPGTFFLDMRTIDRIRNDFVTLHPSGNPQVVAPAQNNGRWRFTFSGPDTTLVYFPMRSKTRAVELEYDVRGFLTRLDERIGDATTPPAATCRIERIGGP